MEGIYYIENSINEYNNSIRGYFPTFEEAKEALKDCSNWWRPKGTGTIYFQEFGLNKNPKEIYKVE